MVQEIKWMEEQGDSKQTDKPRRRLALKCPVNITRFYCGRDATRWLSSTAPDHVLVDTLVEAPPLSLPNPGTISQFYLEMHANSMGGV